MLASLRLSGISIRSHISAWRWVGAELTKICEICDGFGPGGPASLPALGGLPFPLPRLRLATGQLLSTGHHTLTNLHSQNRGALTLQEGTVLLKPDFSFPVAGQNWATCPTINQIPRKRAQESCAWLSPVTGCPWGLERGCLPLMCYAHASVHTAPASPWAWIPRGRATGNASCPLAMPRQAPAVCPTHCPGRHLPPPHGRHLRY